MILSICQWIGNRPSHAPRLPSHRLSDYGELVLAYRQDFYLFASLRLSKSSTLSFLCGNTLMFAHSDWTRALIANSSLYALMARHLPLGWLFARNRFLRLFSDNADFPRSYSLILSNSNSSPPPAYHSIYLSLPSSTKQTLLYLLDTSHQTTHLTHIQPSYSHVIKTKFPLLKYCSYSHTT